MLGVFKFFKPVMRGLVLIAKILEPIISGTYED